MTTAIGMLLVSVGVAAAAMAALFAAALWAPQDMARLLVVPILAASVLVTTELIERPPLRKAVPALQQPEPTR